MPLFVDVYIQNEVFDGQSAHADRTPTTYVWHA